MNLSIIIVNWNSTEYLKKCLAKLLPVRRHLEYEIIVIDSGSYDDCRKMLLQFFPEVKFIQSIDNMGFGKANNEAFKASHGRYILFLNPDTEMEVDGVQALLEVLETIDGAGIVGARLLNSDLSIQKSCVQSFPTIVNQALKSDFLMRRMPNSRLWGARVLYRKDYQTPLEVDVVSGACLMIRRDLFEYVGMFSSDYFMYSEDVDLCYKAKKVGLKIYYVPSAIVIHHGGTSSAKRDINTFSNVLMLESRFRYFKKNKSPTYARSYCLAILIASLLRIGMITIILLNPACRKNKDTLKYSFIKWKVSLRWALGMERWAEEY